MSYVHFWSKKFSLKTLFLPINAWSRHSLICGDIWADVRPLKIWHKMPCRSHFDKIFSSPEKCRSCNERIEEVLPLYFQDERIFLSKNDGRHFTALCLRRRSASLSRKTAICRDATNTFDFASTILFNVISSPTVEYFILIIL